MENSKKNGLSKTNNDKLRRHYAQLAYEMEIWEEEYKDELKQITSEKHSYETKTSMSILSQLKNWFNIRIKKIILWNIFI